MSLCKACGASITWRRTKTGKKMPVNSADHIEDVDEVWDPKTMESHWGTCPEAQQFKNKK